MSIFQLIASHCSWSIFAFGHGIVMWSITTFGYCVVLWIITTFGRCVDITAFGHCDVKYNICTHIWSLYCYVKYNPSWPSHIKSVNKLEKKVEKPLNNYFLDLYNVNGFALYNFMLYMIMCEHMYQFCK